MTSCSPALSPWPVTSCWPAWSELRLFVYPVVLGHGRRLVPHDWAGSTLELLEQRMIHDVLLLRYRIPR